MSWIKKILNIFTVEVEEEETIIDEKKSKVNQMNQTNTYRNIETRMKYEYPKGTFRFPVIPDETKPQNKTDLVVNQGRKNDYKQVTNQNTNQQSKKIYNQVPKTILHHNKNEQQLRKQPVEIQKKNNVNRKVEPKNKQPFRPTEIPSPVYGFKRPTRKSNEAVYEFDLDNSEILNNQNNNSYTHELTPENKEIVDKGISQFNEITNLEPILPIGSKTEIVTEIDVNKEADFHQLDVDYVSDQQIENDYEENENLYEENENELQEEKEVEVKEEEEVKEEGAMDEEETFDEPVETKNSTRSHLPFNVLMLKQDRQKLAENPKAEASEVKNEQTILLNNNEQENKKYPVFAFPSYQLLLPPVKKSSDHEWILEQTNILNETLINFNVRASVVNVSQGPSVTRFEIQPEPGVKVNKVTNLSDDLKLSLAAKDIRIEAPIPGKHTIGIEIPNMQSRPVMISEIIFDSVFKESQSPLTAALGLDISGKPIITDLRKMPHGLIAGATGSGKSVCINSILVSLLYKATPNELKLLLIDPKMVELAPYNHIPHLVSPVITDVKAATAALKWAVEEMERRYELFAHTGVRDIQRFNEIAEKNRQFNDKLPYIVIIIDELADLMMMSPADVEEAICRIAQKARACGIHLIIATQRPSVDVITGLIKANVPTRIAFSVSSQVDSRTIIDISGAEKLLGRGDMLFLENGSSKPVRLQGTFVTDEEIDRVVHHVRQEEKPNYLFEQEELLKKAQIEDEEDEIFFEACEFVIDQGGASTSLLQRNFRIGYNRAARLIEMMEQQGIISEAKGSKPRDILITKNDLEAVYEVHSI